MQEQLADRTQKFQEHQQHIEEATRRATELKQRGLEDKLLEQKLKEADRQDNIERLKRVLEYQRQKQLEQIEADNERTRAIAKQKQDLINQVTIPRCLTYLSSFRRARYILCVAHLSLCHVCVTPLA